MPIPPAHLAPCEFCPEPLDITDPGVHQWTSGWVKNRKEGGGHGISCPVRAKRWAHSWCVERAAKGLTNQERLL